MPLGGVASKERTEGVWGFRMHVVGRGACNRGLGAGRVCRERKCPGEMDVHSLPTTHSTSQQLVGCVCIKRQGIVRRVLALTPRTFEILVPTISPDQVVIPFAACLWRVVDVSSGGMLVSRRRGTAQMKPGSPLECV